MKLALITDTHYGARLDNQIFAEYFQKFYDNIFFPYLDEHNITTVIHLGDVVDRRKYINYKTLNDLRENFIYRLWKMEVDTHIIVGNHDTFYKNTSTPNSMTELFSTANGTVEPWIYDAPREVNYGGLLILMVPWINSDNYDECINAIKTTKAEVMMGHFEIRGFMMNSSRVCDLGMDQKIFDKFDLVFSGHFHHKSSNGPIHYLGNPYEITWSDCGDTRGFHIFDTETRELERIVNPYKMFHKIFYNDSKETFESITEKDYSEYTGSIVKVIVEEKNNPFWFDTLLDKLYKNNAASVSVVENFDMEFEEGEIDQAEDTITILSKYIDSLKLDVNKKKLDNLMLTLYNEALDFEII
jgi:DNA repair exonuclease SbcCD nuclease subunit